VNVGVLLKTVNLQLQPLLLICLIFLQLLSLLLKLLLQLLSLPLPKADAIIARGARSNVFHAVTLTRQSKSL